jgi:sugar phosphate isomerase/epimerase
VLESGPRERQSALDAVKRCLELGDRLPLRYAVLHLGAAGSPFNPVHFEHAYTAISMIRAFSGLRVLLETLPNDIATFSRIAELQIAAQFPDVGICYDTGHGEMDGAPDVIHLNDNHGEGDEHLWPFDGSRDWPALVERLVVQSYDGLFILEGRDDRLERASSCRSRLQDLMDEARNSVEEFRLKYKLPIPQEEFE